MINNKNLNPVVTELFNRGRKVHISLVFIIQSYFKVPKDEILPTFYHKNSKQERTSTNCTKSFIRH